MDNFPLYAGAGLLVGVLVGLTGVGGGSLMTPLLVLLFGFHPATAVGTDLLYASATKTVGTVVHDRRQTVDWRIVGGLAKGSIPAAIVSLLVMARLGPLSPGASKIIGTMLAVALLATGISILFRPAILRWAERRSIGSDERDVRRPTLLLGVVLGVLVSVTSVGAGAIGTTALLILYPRLPVARVAGSDIAHAVPLTLVAGIGHWLIGSVDLGLMVALLAGSIPGIVIGSLVGTRAPDRVLRPVLAMTLVAVSVRMFSA
ncbi:sulfite exporter TauE/SafE family protein [Sphingomonas sp. ASV193]|uniref:sulfite exporter TauE/SafE family protein n=1 Tax=Sphingomonas sp. ASV193 TaxID=3144405 RepID=UPI0032E87363